MTDWTSKTQPLSVQPANNIRFYILMFATVIGTLLVILLNPGTVDGQFNPLFEEGGFIEGLSPMGYVFCVLLIIAHGGFRFAFTRALPLVVVLLAMTLRELNFHVLFTSMSIEKLDFYTSPAVPLHQKVIAFLVIALVAAAVLLLIVRHGRVFLAGLWKLDPVSLGTALAIGEILLSKSIDGINNRLADIGYFMSDETTNMFAKVEETAELGISLYAIIAILAYFGSARDDMGESR